MKNIDNKYIRLTAISGLVVVFDQVAKAIILNRLSLYSSVSVIPGLFNLTHIQTQGVLLDFLPSNRQVCEALFF